MRPVAIIDQAAILGRLRLFEPGAITALAAIHKRVTLILLQRVDDDNRRQEAESVLEGEGVVFESRVKADELNVRADDVAFDDVHPGKSVFVVTRGDADVLAGVDGMHIDVEAAGWPEITRQILFPKRIGAVVRKTSETEVSTRVDLDGTGSADISTGIGFFDHMLEQVARHSGADISISVSGDLHVDEHHTIEDTAISLGEAFGLAIGEKRGIERYAFVLPMDDSLASVAFDWSGRNWLVWDAEFSREKIGDMPTEMFYHFFKSFSDASRCNLNISVRGDNEHHMIESIFKAFGRCLGQASFRRHDDDRVPSTKGTL